MQKIQQIPARLKIAHEIKAAILSGQLAPNSELVQESIASMLGVSRTPVREAFQMLEKDGFIDLVNSKKAIVKKFDASDVSEHYDLRALLESQVAQKAAINHINTTQLHELTQAMDDLAGTPYFIEKNQAFHQIIWDAAQSPKHVELINHLWNRIPAELVSSSKEDHQQANREHKAIVLALDSRDGKRANQMMREHILRTKQDYLKRMGQPKTF
ncbi:MAG: GntR family transcriptional regulator [Erysipelothrix sp.]|jgi:DNA-binding GntR family transcriptional regulator|nr:GntR family transcriptional regulator [Erysipelothrix sp.]